MEVTIGPATSFAAACTLLVLLLVAAQLCLTINSVQVSLRRRYWPRRAAQFLPWVVVPSLTGGAARRYGVVGARYPWVPLLVGVLLTAGCGAGLAWLPFAPAERRDAWRWLAGPSRLLTSRRAAELSFPPPSESSLDVLVQPTEGSVLAPERLRALIGAHNAIVDASARVDAQPVAYADVCERRGGARVGASCALSSPLSLLLPPTAFDDRLHVAADQRSWVPREQPTGATSQLSYAELTAELARTAAQRGEGSAEAEAERWQIRRSLPGLHEGAPSLLAPPPASAARMVFPLRPPPRAAPPTDVDEWGVPDPGAEAAAAVAVAAAEEAAASAVATAAAWERAALAALRAATPPAPPPPTPGLAAPPPGPPTAGITALVDSGAVRAREAVGGAVGGGAALLGWLLLVGVPAVAYLLGSLTPLLRRPLRHAAVLYAGSAAGTAAALGLLGWGASGGGGVGGDGMPPLAPLTPVLLHALVFCIASQAAVVVAASLEAAWRASPDEPTEMKLGHALELAAPPLAAAAAVGVAAIGGGCVARGGAALGSAPLLQHATAAALCLCAGVGVALTTFWASVVYELRPPTVRILMRRTRLPPDADAATRLHLAARRGSPLEAAFFVVVLVVAAAAAAYSAAGVAAATDGSDDYLDGGQLHRIHAATHDAATGAPLQPSSLYVYSPAADLHLASHCTALLAADDALRSAAAVVGLRSWFGAWLDAEQSRDCRRLTARAAAGAVSAFLLREPQWAADVSPCCGGNKTSPAGSLQAWRWHVMVEAPPAGAAAASAAAQQRDALREIQAALDAATANAAGLTLDLLGAPIAAAELAAAAPAAARAWTLGAVAAAAAASLLFLDPIGAVLLLGAAALGAAAVLGTIGVLPLTPSGGGWLVWVCCGVPLFLQLPTLALAALVRSKGDVLAAIDAATPTLGRAAAAALVALAPIAVVFPTAAARAHGWVLAAAAAAGLVVAAVLLPIAHSAVYPPPPPPAALAPRKAADGGLSEISSLVREESLRV